MRKYHKKLILNMLESLDEANQTMRSLLKKKDNDSIMNLLADSQGVINQIAGFLSENKEVPELIFQSLDEYNKQLFFVSQDISTATLKNVRSELNTLTAVIKRELVAEKTVMAFLPYNGSMSDSLESIWLAAHKDPNCQVHLIPIPFYARDTKGNFAKLQDHRDFYLGGQVPVDDWKKVNLEALHPDAIFIHNPYDGNNYVTSVHPNFYSDKLKKYTDCLVYVPYFISFQNTKDNFVLVPGVVNADLVFLETEVLKKEYEAIAAKHIPRDQWKNKFFSYGSTKLDKVIHSKPEDFTLPEDWDRKITAPDGSKKKIVLYVTTVGAILTNGEKHLKKMQAVFRYFKKRDDVVFWWRPHPLEMETYQSMRPQLLQDYQQTVQQYQDDGFGILDESMDLHRAVCYSDLYYGDVSSVLNLFVATEKLMVRQILDVVEYRDYEVEPYVFSGAWRERIQLNLQENLLPPFWPGAVGEQYRIWDGKELGDLILDLALLSFYLDVMKGNASAERQKNRAYLLFVRNQRLKEKGLLLDGTAGERIFNHVKEEILK